MFKYEKSLEGLTKEDVQLNARKKLQIFNLLFLCFY